MATIVLLVRQPVVQVEAGAGTFEDMGMEGQAMEPRHRWELLALWK